MCSTFGTRFFWEVYNNSNGFEVLYIICGMRTVRGNEVFYNNEKNKDIMYKWLVY